MSTPSKQIYTPPPENAQHSLDDFLRLVTEHVSDIICVHAPDGSFAYVSPSIEEIMGYLPDELTDRSPYDFLHEEDAKEAVRPAHDDLLKGKKSVFRCRFRHKQGHYVWIETTNDFVPDDQGGAVWLTTSSRDITLRKSLEDRIRLFKIIVENANDSIMVTDVDQRIIYANPAFLSLTGYEMEEILGRVPGDFLQGEDTDNETTGQIQKAIERKEVGTFEILNYRKSGEPFFVRLLIQPIIDPKEGHKGFFSIQRDITTEKMVRENLILLNAQLADKNKELEQLNKELEQFAYIASHDLKEPLKNIIGIMYLLKDSMAGKMEQEDRELIDHAEQSGDRLSRMIDSLLEYSRSGRASEPVSVICPGEVLESLKDEFSATIENKGIQVHSHNLHTEIQGYPIAFRRLLQNLLSNSLKHGIGNNGSITVSMLEQPGFWEIHFADNGPGIPQEHRDKIFNLFNRLSSSSESNGIGLAMCKRIAELHGGSIELSGETEEGALFIVKLSRNLTGKNESRKKEQE